MDHWNYRVLAKRNVVNGITVVEFAIYEVQYENDVPISHYEHTTTPVYFSDESSEPIYSLKWQLDAMKLACDKPVLDYDNFPNEYLPYSRKKKLDKIDKFYKSYKL